MVVKFDNPFFFSVSEHMDIVPSISVLALVIHCEIRDALFVDHFHCLF